MIATAIMLSAAGVASGGAFDGADAADDCRAGGAGVGVFPNHSSRLEGQGVADVFTGDAKICACGFPLDAVGRDLSGAAARVGEKMGELVLEGAEGLVFRKFF